MMQYTHDKFMKLCMYLINIGIVLLLEQEVKGWLLSGLVLGLSILEVAYVAKCGPCFDVKILANCKQMREYRKQSFLHC